MPEGAAPADSGPAGGHPRFGFYGDDFTGSVDALLQFARGGLSGRLFVGVPTAGVLARVASEGDVDVIGIAGIARSLPTAELDAEVRPALAALVATGASVVQYKACSTADSSPTVGSLGRVLEIGRSLVGARPVPVLFAQPDFGRYTVFGHHFAAEGGTVHRLDRQPTMSAHPSTPMTESDLARHLAAQTALPIGALHYPAYGASPAGSSSIAPPSRQAAAGARPASLPSTRVESTAFFDPGAEPASSLAAAIDSAPFAAVVLDAADQAHVDLIGQAVLALGQVAQTGYLAGPEQHSARPDDLARHPEGEAVATAQVARTGYPTGPEQHFALPDDLAHRPEPEAVTPTTAQVAQTGYPTRPEQQSALPGEDARGVVFAIGAGGLSYGLARAARGDAARAARAARTEPGNAGRIARAARGDGGSSARATPARGAVLAVSGSRSARTRAQADAAAAAGWTVLPLPLAPDTAFIAEVIDTLRAGTSVALTSDDADLAPAAGRPVLIAIAEAAASVVDAVARAGAVGRVIVCGGDTSSRVTRLLGVESLSIAANPEGNIVLCAAHAPDPAIDGLELLLKGGQVGDVDLFERMRTLGL